ncbi:site-specific DNA-methyltransferase [Lactococcus formosensis]|uniref:site-specific DNA-methyltransferase n=2 Tax=Bacillota TaxID=1239 RepID=UPI00254AB990|nr:site-specific DNA-methyltransferase [Lactococcus formosensis]
MIKDTWEKNENASANKKEITVLKEHFPACFKEDGSFDIERFKEYLSEDINVINEGYELKFLGKNYARLLVTLETETVIVPNEEHNQKEENKDSENIYITGDNLDGLKHLLKSYAGKVKCIYIDPPYNTGSDGFVYNDNFNFTIEELTEKLSIGEEQAKRILDLKQRSSASDSAWLMFMYPRLQLARDLLSDDGVIFVSIDDNQQANLKLMCDDVFGIENFVSQIIVQSNKRGQTYKELAKTHEYLLTYTKNIDGKINELMKDVGSFKMADNLGDFSERDLRNRNPKFGRFNRPNLYYPIYVNPDEVDKNGFSPISLIKNDDFKVEVIPLNSEGKESCWRWGKNKFTDNNAENSMDSNVVARLKTTGEYGIYEKYRKTTYKAKTIWYNEEIVSDLIEEDDDIWDETGVITEQGSVELRKYGMGETFDFPKPTYLIKKILTLGSDNDSICLDFFSGSATTAEAVLQLNNELGNEGKRRFISIQLPENLKSKLEESSKSEKEKINNVINFLETNKRYPTLDQVGIERIVRVANIIKEENPETTIDLGFKHFTLAEPTADTINDLVEFNPSENAMIINNTILDDFGVPTVITTWLNNDGYGLTTEVVKISFSGYEAYYKDKYLYLVHPELPNEAIEEIVVKYETDGDFNPENIVLFGYSFTWTELESLKTNLKRLQDTEKNLRINFDIRY